MTPIVAATISRWRRSSNGERNSSCSRSAISSGRFGRGNLQEQQGELVAAPAREHSLERRRRFLEAAGGLDHELVAGRMAQHVVDELEAGDIDDDDGDALAPLRAHVAQRTVELVHEIAPVRQSGERIVKARVVEGFLQIQALLHLGRELLIDRRAGAPRGRQGGARALQRMAQIVSAEGEEPRQERQQPDFRREQRGRIPAGVRADRDLADSFREWRPARRQSESVPRTASVSGSVLELTKMRDRALRGSTWDSSKS